MGSSDGEVTFTVTGTSSPSFNYTLETDEGVLLASGTGNYDAAISFFAAPIGTHSIIIDDPNLGCQSTSNFTIINGGPVAAICASSLACDVLTDGSHTSELSITVDRLRDQNQDRFDYEIRDINDAVVHDGYGYIGELIEPKPVVGYTGNDYTLYVRTKGNSRL